MLLVIITFAWFLVLAMIIFSTPGACLSWLGLDQVSPRRLGSSQAFYGILHNLATRGLAFKLGIWQMLSLNFLGQYRIGNPSRWDKREACTHRHEKLSLPRGAWPQLDLEPDHVLSDAYFRLVGAAGIHV